MVKFFIPTILILTGLWFFSSYIVKKIYSFKRKPVRLVVTSLLTIMIYALSITLLLSYLIKPEKEFFDSEKWVEKEEIRYKMIDNLINEKILIGKDTSKVKVIIGKPSRKIDNHIWSYRILGNDNFDFFYIDLRILFKNNEVIKVEKK